MPSINQRLTVDAAAREALSTRVEDIHDDEFDLALPALPLEPGDHVELSWERDATWYRLRTTVLAVDEDSIVPTMRVAARGELRQFDDRRTDTRCAVQLPIQLRVLRSRAIRPGRELNTSTIELSSTAVRFVTTAPFAPGDVMETRIQLDDAPDGTVAARVRIIRVDAMTGSWRSTCTATFEEILRSDKARITALADTLAARGAMGLAVGSPTLEPIAPPTHDGVGGRDAPQRFETLAEAVEYARRFRA